MENNKPKICPVCGKEYEFALKIMYNKDGNTCEHDNPTIGPSKTEIRRKENIESTIMARRQATEYSAGLPKEEMIMVNPPKGDTGKRPEVVPKRVVEAIEQKLNINQE